MSKRKFLVPMAALVLAVVSQQALADVSDVKTDNAPAVSQNVVASSNQSPFDFVLKRSESAVQVFGYHSSHASHSSHSSHRSHYSSR
ncbi:MAG: His-Xaa-Ser repeat protein HxsA2 [Methylophilaceae bacterium]|nr:His-Xaa-Ser repeat protein HxsA2 [Methylophilaceae bacterium]